MEVSASASRGPRTTPATVGPLASLTLAVVTFHRPKALARCLEGIIGMRPPQEPIDVQILVVDNDADASASEVVREIAGRSPWPIKYVVESSQGIPHARNRALSESADTEAIGFVDDDEVPAPEWLRSMLREWQATGADILMGPSVPRFVDPPPHWVERGGFFERPRFETGQPFPTDQSRTSGVLIARRALPAETNVFDDRFRYSGGSDTYLFGRMAASGRSFVWVDDAVVEEWVPASRATARWLLRRAFRIGNTRSLVLVADGASMFRRGRRLAGAVPLTALLVWRALPELRTGRAGLVRVGQQVANGAGVAAGALGFRYREYRRRVHGS